MKTLINATLDLALDRDIQTFVLLLSAQWVIVGLGLAYILLHPMTL